MDSNGNQRKRGGRVVKNTSANECMSPEQDSETNEVMEVSAVAISPTLEEAETTLNAPECRRSSRKKIIKFDVRDLLNKNRKTHKIQIEARIDSNAPATSKATTASNNESSNSKNASTNREDLLSKQKTFLEKSAIFRRYSVSQDNKPPPLPLPMPPLLGKSNEKDIKLADNTRRLSRTQEFFSNVMIKPKQTTSLIVAQIESNKPSTSILTKRRSLNKSLELEPKNVIDHVTNVQQKKRGRPAKLKMQTSAQTVASLPATPEESKKKLTPEKAKNWKEYKECLAQQTGSSNKEIQELKNVEKEKQPSELEVSSSFLISFEESQQSDISKSEDDDFSGFKTSKEDLSCDSPVLARISKGKEEKIQDFEKDTKDSYAPQSSSETKIETINEVLLQDKKFALDQMHEKDKIDLNVLETFPTSEEDSKTENLPKALNIKDALNLAEVSLFKGINRKPQDLTQKKEAASTSTKDKKKQANEELDTDNEKNLSSNSPIPIKQSLRTKSRRLKKENSRDSSSNSEASFNTDKTEVNKEIKVMTPNTPKILTKTAEQIIDECTPETKLSDTDISILTNLIAPASEPSTPSDTTIQTSSRTSSSSESENNSERSSYSSDPSMSSRSLRSYKSGDKLKVSLKRISLPKSPSTSSQTSTSEELNSGLNTEVLKKKPPMAKRSKRLQKKFIELLDFNEDTDMSFETHKKEAEVEINLEQKDDQISLSDIKVSVTKNKEKLVTKIEKSNETEKNCAIQNQNFEEANIKPGSSKQVEEAENEEEFINLFEEQAQEQTFTRKSLRNRKGNESEGSEKSVTQVEEGQLKESTLYKTLEKNSDEEPQTEKLQLDAESENSNENKLLRTTRTSKELIQQKPKKQLLQLEETEDISMASMEETKHHEATISKKLIEQKESNQEKSNLKTETVLKDTSLQKSKQTNEEKDETISKTSKGSTESIKQTDNDYKTNKNEKLENSVVIEASLEKMATNSEEQTTTIVSSSAQIETFTRSKTNNDDISKKTTMIEKEIFLEKEALETEAKGSKSPKEAILLTIKETTRRSITTRKKNNKDDTVLEEKEQETLETEAKRTKSPKEELAPSIKETTKRSTPTRKKNSKEDTESLEKTHKEGNPEDKSTLVPEIKVINKKNSEQFKDRNKSPKSKSTAFEEKLTEDQVDVKGKRVVQEKVGVVPENEDVVPEKEVSKISKRSSPTSLKTCKNETIAKETKIQKSTKDEQYKDTEVSELAKKSSPVRRKTYKEETSIKTPKEISTEKDNFEEKVVAKTVSGKIPKEDQTKKEQCEALVTKQVPEKEILETARKSTPTRRKTYKEETSVKILKETSAKKEYCEAAVVTKTVPEKEISEIVEKSIPTRRKTYKEETSVKPCKIIKECLNKKEECKDVVARTVPEKEISDTAKKSTPTRRKTYKEETSVKPGQILKETLTEKEQYESAVPEKLSKENPTEQCEAAVINTDPENEIVEITRKSTPTRRKLCKEETSARKGNNEELIAKKSAARYPSEPILFSGLETKDAESFKTSKESKSSKSPERKLSEAIFTSFIETKNSETSKGSKSSKDSITENSSLKVTPTRSKTKKEDTKTTIFKDKGTKETALPLETAEIKKHLKNESVSLSPQLKDDTNNVSNENVSDINAECFTTSQGTILTTKTQENEHLTDRHCSATRKSLRYQKDQSKNEKLTETTSALTLEETTTTLQREELQTDEPQPAEEVPIKLTKRKGRKSRFKNLYGPDFESETDSSNGKSTPIKEINQKLKDETKDSVKETKNEEKVTEENVEKPLLTLKESKSIEENNTVAKENPAKQIDEASEDNSKTNLSSSQIKNVSIGTNTLLDILRTVQSNTEAALKANIEVDKTNNKEDKDKECKIRDNLEEGERQKLVPTLDSPKRSNSKSPLTLDKVNFSPARSDSASPLTLKKVPQSPTRSDSSSPLSLKKVTRRYERRSRRGEDIGNKTLEETFAEIAAQSSKAVLAAKEFDENEEQQTSDEKQGEDFKVHEAKAFIEEASETEEKSAIEIDKKDLKIEENIKEKLKIVEQPSEFVEKTEIVEEIKITENKVETPEPTKVTPARRGRKPKNRNLEVPITKEVDESLTTSKMDIAEKERNQQIPTEEKQYPQISSETQTTTESDIPQQEAKIDNEANSSKKSNTTGDTELSLLADNNVPEQPNVAEIVLSKPAESTMTTLETADVNKIGKKSIKKHDVDKTETELQLLKKDDNNDNDQTKSAEAVLSSPAESSVKTLEAAEETKMGKKPIRNSDCIKTKPQLELLKDADKNVLDLPKVTEAVLSTPAESSVKTLETSNENKTGRKSLKKHNLSKTESLSEELSNYDAAVSTKDNEEEIRTPKQTAKRRDTSQTKSETKSSGGKKSQKKSKPEEEEEILAINLPNILTTTPPPSKRGRKPKNNKPETPQSSSGTNRKNKKDSSSDNEEKTKPLDSESDNMNTSLDKSLDEKLAKKKRQKKLKEAFEAALTDNLAGKTKEIDNKTNTNFGLTLINKSPPPPEITPLTSNNSEDEFLKISCITPVETEEDPDPLKDIEKFILDGVNLLKKDYKIDEDSVDDVIATTTPAKTTEVVEDSIKSSPEEFKQVFNTFETPADTPINTPSVTPPPKSPISIESSTPDENSGVRRSHRIKQITKTPKALVGRGLVRDKERFSIKDDVETKSHYTLDDHLLDLAEVEAKNAKFLKEMEERLSNFQVIKENEYLCERVISREARKMICDCFLTHDEEERGELACGEDCLNRLLMIECGPDCNIKERCTNKRFQKLLCSPCRVFRTEKKGFGIMADIEILPGEFIMEYVGEVIDTDEFEKRRILYSQDKNRHYYFMALRSDAIIDATIKGNISRFINHSCDPNAETQKWTVNGELRIGFFSRKSIMPGEEITFNYQYQRYGREAQRCYCESSNCTGWIGQEPTSDEGEQIDDGEEEYEESEDEEEEADTSNLLVQDDDEDSDASVADPEEVQKQLEMAAAQAEVELAPLQLIENKTQETESLPKEEGSNKTDSEEDSKSKFKKLLTKMAEKVAAKQKQTKREEKQKRKKKSKDSATDLTNKLRFLEDPDIEDEVEFLKECGLKNQSDTLRLSRLMVRAKLVQTRLNLLEILRLGDLPCRRLFLDYHGMRLIHGWMSEDAGNMQIRLALLQTLETLPIANKTVLTDSKVMQVVRIWCGHNTNLSPNEDSSSSNSNSQDNSVANFEESSELQKLALKLITTWEGLPEIFRIPKKERIEQMKEHEREADRQYAANAETQENTSETDRYRRDRFGRGFNSSHLQPSSSSSRFVKPKNVNQHRTTNTTPENNKNLSKAQRREMFAAKVARDEAEKRLAEERREFETKCRFFGLDPKKTRLQDIPFSVNPATGQWFSVERKPITTPPSYAHVQVPVKPKSTDPNDYQLPAVCSTLPPQWKYAITDQGKIYYYHVKHRIPQWEPPSPVQLLQCEMEYKEEDSETELTNTAGEDSSDDDEDMLIGMDAAQLKAYIDRKVEIRRQKRYQRLVDERCISPRREEDRIYNQIEVRKYKENKEKIRKRKEEIRRKRAEALRQTSLNMCTLGSITDTNPSSNKLLTESDEELGALPIQDYLLSSDDEIDIKAEVNSPLIDKIVEGDKIVDELDALTTKRQLKRPLPPHRDLNEPSTSASALASTPGLNPLTARQEYKKRKLEKKEKRKPKEQDAKYRKTKEKFRCEIAGIIVHHLKPYRKDSCSVGRIQSNDDFNHLARKLTHFVMIKELKYCESVGQTLVVTESVKSKSREFIKKYMAKYGDVYVKPLNDPDFKDIPFTL